MEQDIVLAMKAREAEKVGALRMVISAIKNEAIAKRKELSEDEVLVVVAREIKKRKESAEAYKNGGRDDLSESELKEAALLQKYLPEPLSESELQQLVQDVIQETGAKSVKDMGNVISKVMAKAQGKAEGKVVSEKVRQLLA